MRLSVGRVMVAVAVLAVGLAALKAFGPEPPGRGLGMLALVPVLVAGTDRALFARRRAGWAGLVAAGGAYLALVLSFHREAYQSLSSHVLPVAFGPARSRGPLDRLGADLGYAAVVLVGGLAAAGAG